MTTLTTVGYGDISLADQGGPLKAFNIVEADESPAHEGAAIVLTRAGGRVLLLREATA